jgi:hypothetical protein
VWGGAEVYGVDPTAQTQEGWTQIALGLYSNLPKLADGIYLQWVWVHTQANIETTGSVEDQEVFAYQRRRREEFLRAKRLTSKRLYVFFSARQCLDSKEFTTVSPGTHRAAVAEVVALEEALRDAFKRSGLELRHLIEVELFELLAQGVAPDGNPRRYLVDEPMPPEDLLREDKRLMPLSPREQLFTDNPSWDAGHLKLGDTYIKVLACDQLPPTTRLRQLETLEGLDFDFRLVLHMQLPPRHVAEAVFRQQRRFANAFAFKKHGPSDTAAQVGLADMDELDRELVAGARLVRVGLQAVVTAPTEVDVTRRAKTLLGALNNIDFRMFEESWAHDREYFKTLPGMAGGFDRWRMVSSHVASDLIPIGAYSRGDRNPLLTFQNTQSGEPFGYSLRERVRANDNWMVLGASGAGKSVLVNMLLAYQMLSGPYRGRILAVDYASPEKSSFRTACEVFGGRYISIAGNGQKINPWRPKKEAWLNGAMRPAVLSVLTQVTNTLLYNEGASKEEALYEALIQMGIAKVYAKHEGDAPPTYGDLLPVFEAMRAGGEDATKMEHLIGLLRKLLNGPESLLFNSQSKISSDGDFICYDLFGLKEYDARVRAAVAAIVMQHVRALAFDGHPERYKYIPLEEVTNLLAIGLKPMVEELITTARAHGTSVGVITQEYEAYRRSGVDQTINLNTTTKFLMSHKKAGNVMDPVIADMNLNEAEAALFRSLEAATGGYSELILKTQCWSPAGGRDVTAKLRFELSPFDYQVVTSNAQDRARQNKLTEHFPNAKRVQILDYLAYGRPVQG